jgi:hypothetical protein
MGSPHFNRAVAARRMNRVLAQTGLSVCLWVGDVRSVCRIWFPWTAKGFRPSMIDDPTYPTKIKPLKIASTATTGFQGTRISIALPPGIESSLRLTDILPRRRNRMKRKWLERIPDLDAGLLPLEIRLETPPSPYEIWEDNQNKQQ